MKKRDAIFFKSWHSRSKECNTHAKENGDYLIPQGSTMRLFSLNRPRQLWESIEENMATTFQKIDTMARLDSTIRTIVLIDTIMENQIQAKHVMANSLGRVSFADNQAAALLIIDHELSLGKHQTKKDSINTSKLFN